MTNNLSECLNKETFNKTVPAIDVQAVCCFSLPITFPVLAGLSYITVTLFKLVRTYFKLRFYRKLKFQAVYIFVSLSSVPLLYLYQETIEILLARYSPIYKKKCLFF